MNWKQIFVGGLTLVATVSAIFGVGYAIGKDHNEALVNFLREKNQGFESTERILRAEIENLKIELKSTHVMTENAAPNLQGKANSESSAIGTLDASITPTNDKLSNTTVTVSAERTVSALNDQLLITVQGLRYEGAPLRHRVYATLGRPGKPNKELNGVDPGFVVTYEGLEVRIIASDTFTATFLVTRITPTN